MIDNLSLAAEADKVLQQLMDNGSFDELRKQVIEELKSNEVSDVSDMRCKSSSDARCLSFSP